jgi:hypothetical protein
MDELTFTITKSEYYSIRNILFDKMASLTILSEKARVKSHTKNSIEIQNKVLKLQLLLAKLNIAFKDQHPKEYLRLQEVLTQNAKIQN